MSRPSDTSRPPTRRHAFTLLEVMVVVVIASILASMTLAGLGGVGGLRRDMGAEEVRRVLRHARAHAAATGEPSCARIDPDAETLTLLRVDAETGNVVPMLGPLGEERSANSVAVVLRGVEIDSASGGDGASGAIDVWFDYRGRPHLRDAGGAFVAWFSEDASVTIREGETVIVRRETGLVE